MIIFKPCEDWHIALIKAQVAQTEEKQLMLDTVDSVVGNSLALSCWIDDMCVGAAGLRPIWRGRVAAWMLLSADAGPAMVAIAKKLRFVLATCPANRIEMTVRESFGPGCRLAGLLGFNEEARLPYFFPDGTAARLFARLKG